jgi:TPR repeat protein
MLTCIEHRHALLWLVLLSVSAYGQESYESRAARLQPEDIAPLIEKADAGDLSSEVLLWLAYSHGYAVPKDFQKGLPWLRKAAEKGSPEAEWVLSTIYDFGRGRVPVDHGEAFKWALKAAQRGHPVAQHNVASAYFYGRGVDKDLGQARYWYQQAAEQGFAHSQWSLGEMYLKGDGIAPNRDEAVKWLTKAVAQNHAPSMVTLADIYSDANGVPQQPQLVFDLLRAAAQLGTHVAEFKLGRFYREGDLAAPDYAQALMWFSRAANAGYGPADQYLAAMYETGQGVPTDLNQARTHYEHAANLGVSGTIQKMGEFYRDGSGVPQDPVNALMWFTIGAKQDFAESNDALQALASTLTEPQRQIAAARANTWMVEHPDAIQQKPNHFFYQDWVMVDQDGPRPSRGPSTADERQYAIFLSKRLEKDPLSLDAYAARAWLDKWWEEIPDITVRPCNLVDPPSHEHYQYETEVYKQITYSEGVYLLENPGRTTDWQAAFLAGMSGALSAYRLILQAKPSATSSFLDDLLHQRDTGQLAATVRQLVQQRCK